MEPFLKYDGNTKMAAAAWLYFLAKGFHYCYKYLWITTLFLRMVDSLADSTIRTNFDEVASLTKNLDICGSSTDKIK